MTAPRLHRGRPARLLVAGDFTLDAHTPGLCGLPEDLAAVWAEARYEAADRVFAAATEYAVDGLILTGRLLSQSAEALRGPAFLDSRLRSLSEAGVPTVLAVSDERPHAFPDWTARGRRLAACDAGRLSGVLVTRLPGGGVSVETAGRSVDMPPPTPPQSSVATGAHGATLLEVSDSGFEQTLLPTDNVRFHEFPIQATDGTRWEQLVETMTGHLHAVAAGCEDASVSLHAVRWVVRGHGPAWLRLLASGPHADLLDALRSGPRRRTPSAWADAVEAVADDTQLARWGNESTPSGRFAAQLARRAGRPLGEPLMTAAAGAAATLRP